MLYGEFRHGLDPKNRLFIPAKHRDELAAEGESFIVAKSIREKCLKVFSASEWEAYISPFMKMQRKESEAILRALHKDAAQVSADSQGRIVIPQALVSYAGIVKGAVIVGCGNYGEIWAEEAYDKMVAEEDLVSMKELLESYGL